MIPADVLGRVAELTDGTGGGSVDAATGAAIGLYRKSRIRGQRLDAHAFNVAEHVAADRLTREPAW
jgi:hypothetical protein